jgi:ABC-type Fe3+-hydroxamate transport system substrate-binding protein
MGGGNGYSAILTFLRPPTRVVSLVPSMTESIFDLGAGASLIGVTDYCRPPEDSTPRLTRIGGTKSPNVAGILALKPDLVVANQEENSRESVEALEAGGAKVWVTFPRSVEDAIAILWVLIRLFDIPAAGSKVRTLEVTLDWQMRSAHATPPVSVFCPIWQGVTGKGVLWWMTFNRETYAHDVLARCGGNNIFADRSRRYPLEADLGQAEAEDAGSRDTRYPRLTPEEVILAQPEAILIPDEPFAFSDDDEIRLRSLLAETPAVQANRVHRIDGSLLTWHGTRLARALAELPNCLHGAAKAGRESSSGSEEAGEGSEAL